MATDTETGGTTRIEELGAKERPDNIGAANPYVLAEVRLGRKVNWQRTPRAHEILEQALGMKYEDLFDPRKPSPIFAGKAVKKNGETVRSEPPIDVGSVVWADPGEFFDEAAEFFDPVQGAVGDCYLIAALASIAWARPYLIAQMTRATGTGPQAFVDMIERRVVRIVVMRATVHLVSADDCLLLRPLMQPVLDAELTRYRDLRGVDVDSRITTPPTSPTRVATCWRSSRCRRGASGVRRLRCGRRQPRPGSVGRSRAIPRSAESCSATSARSARRRSRT